MNKNYIINYLDRGNIYLPNETPYLEIKKIKPGFIFYFQKNVESKKVWEFKPTYSKKLNFNFFKKSLTNILNEHFKQKKLLCSTFSSGLDSSIINFYIQKILKIKNSISYSFDFKFGDNKEKFLIKKIVKKYKIRHKFVKIYKKDLFRKLNRYLNFKQIPIQSDNLFYLSILCSQQKRIILKY